MMDFKGVACRRESEKAILVEIPELSGEFWIPQSQITADSEVWREGDLGTLTVTDWYAEQKGWI